jgi:hypothetical protein
LVHHFPFSERERLIIPQAPQEVLESNWQWKFRLKMQTATMPLSGKKDLICFKGWSLLLSSPSYNPFRLSYDGTK